MMCRDRACGWQLYVLAAQVSILVSLHAFIIICVVFRGGSPDLGLRGRLAHA